MCGDLHRRRQPDLCAVGRRSADCLPQRLFTGDGEDELEDVSFTVERGETVGIIGTTGAGKTTLINLLMRFL